MLAFSSDYFIPAIKLTESFYDLLSSELFYLPVLFINSG
jgi:hypothetical protein